MIIMHKENKACLGLFFGIVTLFSWQLSTFVAKFTMHLDVLFVRFSEFPLISWFSLLKYVVVTHRFVVFITVRRIRFSCFILKKIKIHDNFLFSSVGFGETYNLVLAGFAWFTQYCTGVLNILDTDPQIWSLCEGPLF